MGDTVISRLFKKRYQKKDGTNRDSTFGAAALPSIYKSLREVEDISYGDEIETMKMTKDIAYEKGYYIHNYVMNFERSIQALNLHDVIGSTLAPYSSELDRRLKIIKQAVTPSSQEAVAIQQMCNDNKFSQLFIQLKDNASKIKTAMKKTSGSGVNNFTTFADVQEIKKQAIEEITKEITVRNAQFLDKELLESITEQVVNYINGLSKDQLLSAISFGSALEEKKFDKVSGGRTKAGKEEARQTNIAAYTKFAKSSLASFYILGKTLEIASTWVKQTEGLKNDKRYTNAMETLEFLNMLQNNSFTRFIEVHPSQLARDLGFAYEPFTKAMYGGELTGFKNSDADATDIILSGLNNLEGSLRTSLKTSNTIYRTDSIENFFDSDLVEKENKNFEKAMRPVKYFLLNFTMLSEFQLMNKKTTTREKGFFKDKSLIGSSIVMDLYKEITTEMGKFYFTNLIVGFILKHWTTENLSKLELPKVIMSSRSEKLFPTYNLITALENKNLAGESTFLHLEVTGDLGMAYGNFVESKIYSFATLKRQRRKDGKTALTYQTLLDTEGLKDKYNILSGLGDKAKLLTAVDIAVMMEQVK